MSIVIEKPWTRQPQVRGILPNQKYGAVYFFNPAFRVIDATYTNTSAYQNKYGTGQQFNGGSANASQVNLGLVANDIFTSSVNPQGGFGVFIFKTGATLSPNNSVAGRCDSGANRGWVLRFSSAGALSFDLIAPSANQVTTSATGLITTNSFYVVVISSNGNHLDSNATKMWCNGVLVNSTQVAGSGTRATDSADNLLVGSLPAVWGASSLLGDITLAAFGRKRLADAACIDLCNNPWQLYASQQRILFAPAAAGSALDILATIASATANGYTAAVDRQLAVSSTLATASSSGYTSTVDLQTAITGTLGIAVASAFPATVDRQLAIAATLATASANGLLAQVDLQRAISASLATAVANGYEASVQLGSDLNINAIIATATAAAFNATIDRQIAISGSLATAVADGLLAQVDLQRAIAASLATAVANGYEASVQLGSDLNINAIIATATAAAFNATIDRQLAVAATLATASAAGLDAAINFSDDIIAAMTFTLADRTATFTLADRTATFTLADRTATFTRDF